MGAAALTLDMSAQGPSTLGNGEQRVLKKKVSCAVKLGQSHVLCSLVEQPQESTVLQRGQLAHVRVSLTLAKDATGGNIRRDLLEEKEL